MKLIIHVLTPEGQLLNWQEIDMPVSDQTTAVQASLVDTKTKEVSGTVVIPIQVALANIRAKRGYYYAEYDATESKWIIYNRHISGTHGKFADGNEAEKECDRRNGQT